MKEFISKWGFLLTSILFLLASVVPQWTGGSIHVAFFVLAMAFLAIGLGAVKKNIEH